MPMPGDDSAYRRLLASLRPMNSVLVAFSGGADSTLVLRAALDALGPDRVLAVTAATPLHPAAEAEAAAALAATLGARHAVISCDLLAVPEVAGNDPRRCYFCKRHLFTALRRRAEAVGLAQVVDGSQRDDQSGYRPGRQALRELGIRSPLLEAGLGKAEVRELGQALGLPVWNRPAAPCLATRFPYHTPLTEAGLRRVERIEAWLAQQGYGPCRVRDHGPLVRIELPLPQQIRLLQGADGAELVARLRQEGFHHLTLDLEGLVSGSMDRTLAGSGGDG